MIVVVGGGVIGLACAWTLARAKHAVSLFEKNNPASEASWAAAGMLAPAGEFAAESPLAKMALASLSRYPDFIADLNEHAHSPIDYRRCGSIEVAFDEIEAAALLHRSLVQARMGIPSETIDYQGRPSRFYPEDALVNPRHITGALRHACKRSGVRIHADEPVRAIANTGLSVKTDRATYACEGVLVAAGAWSSLVHSELVDSIPVRGHLLGWREETSGNRPILRNGGTYAVQRVGGEVIAGSSTEYVGYSRVIDEATVEEIRNRVARLLQRTPPVDAAVWNGLRPSTEGGMPVIGRIADTKIVTAYGHYRNGILLAPETARLVGELFST